LFLVIKSQISDTNKIVPVHRNTFSLSNVKINNGINSLLISPFIINPASLGEDASISTSNYESVLNKFPKKIEVGTSPREEFSDKIVEYMSKKLENLKLTLLNSHTTLQEVFITEDTCTPTRCDEFLLENFDNIDDEYIEDNEVESLYVPYSSEQKEKIIQELESDARIRQTKYFDLFKDLKFEIKDTLHNAFAGIESNENIVRKDDKIKQVESFQIDRRETEIFLTQESTTTVMEINKKSELERNSRINNVTKFNITPKKNNNKTDLKNRLTNLKTDNKPRLQMRTSNKQKTTAEKLKVVKKLGITNQQNRNVSIRNSKKIIEIDSPSNNEAIDLIQITKQKYSKPMTENIKRKRISNGAGTSTAPKDLVEQVNPRQRFYTQTKPGRKKKIENIKDTKNLVKLESISQINENVINIQPLNNTEYNSSMEKPNTDLSMQNNIADGNTSSTKVKNARSNTVRFNIQGKSQKTIKLPFIKNDTYTYTSSPLISVFENEEPLDDYKIKSLEDPKFDSEIKYIFKSIILNDNTEEELGSLNTYGKSLPENKSSRKRPIINTIDSIPYYDDSDNKLSDPLEYYTLNDESVLHKFPVLNMNTNNFTNDSFIERNKKNRTDKVLIHASSGKRISTQIKCESLEYKENEVILFNNPT